MINDFAVARALHVLALVHWIGGVTMVTTIVLPRAGALADAHAALAAFEAFENPFAAQARFSILLAGLSGFYMLNKMQAWTLLLDPAFWWLALMVAVWAVFALVVFVLDRRHEQMSAIRLIFDQPKALLAAAEEQVPKRAPA